MQRLFLVSLAKIISCPRISAWANQTLPGHEETNNCQERNSSDVPVLGMSKILKQRWNAAIVSLLSTVSDLVGSWQCALWPLLLTPLSRPLSLSPDNLSWQEPSVQSRELAHKIGSHHPEIVVSYRLKLNCSDTLLTNEANNTGDQWQEGTTRQ